MNSSIGRRISLIIFIVVFFTVALFEIVFSLGVRQFYYGGALGIITDKALSNANFYNMYLKYESLEDKAVTILNNYREQDTAELQILDINGNIIVSSTGFIPEERVDVSFGKRLEVGEINSWQGRIHITDEEVLAVSTPLIEGDTIVGYLRLVSSTEGIKAVVKGVIFKAMITGSLILALSVIISVLLSRTIVRPIKNLTNISKDIAKGNFDIVAEKKYNDEIGELSDTINLMLKEIKNSNDLKNDFISSISHEIRTPLTSIRGWAETINESPINSNESKQGIRVIMDESKRLTKLVEELLDFSRFEAGRFDMNFEEVDLNLLIKDILKQYKIKLEEKNIQVISSFDEKITFINGDENRLKQTFINIIDNACKFSYEYGKIFVTTESTPQGARVLIEDNGVGIPSSELPKVMDKFYKGKNKQSGSGLGLSISKKIISLHKGKMHIASVEGNGTKVTVELLCYKTNQHNQGDRYHDLSKKI